MGDQPDPPSVARWEADGSYVEELYLIHLGSGLVIERRTWRRDMTDSDAFSGMLRAISSFVDDSISHDSGPGLIRLERGDNLILAMEGKHAAIAAIIRERGTPLTEPQARLVSGVMLKTVRHLEQIHAQTIVNWNGRPQVVPRIRRELDVLSLALDDVLLSADGTTRGMDETASAAPFPWIATRARLEAASALHRLGKREEASAWIEGLSVPVDTPPYERAHLLHLLGSVLEAVNETELGRAAYEECAGVDAPNAKCLSALGLGRIEWRRGHYRKALHLIREARYEATAVGELECLVAALISEGAALSRIYDEVENRGDLTLIEEAIPPTRQALAIATHGRLRRLQAFAQLNLAELNRLIGKTGMCIELAQAALAGFEELAEPLPVGQARGLIGRAALEQHRKEEAARAALEMLAIPETHLSADDAVRLKCSAGEILRLAEHPAASRRAYEGALSIAESHYLVVYADQIRKELSRLAG